MSFDTPVHFVLFVVIYSAILIGSVAYTVCEQFKVTRFEGFKLGAVVWVTFVAVLVALRIVLAVVGVFFAWVAGVS